MTMGRPRPMTNPQRFEIAATPTLRGSPTPAHAPANDGSALAHRAAETAQPEALRSVAESFRDSARIARSHCLRSNAARARTTHTSANPREPRARTPREIADTPAPPTLSAPLRPHSFPTLPCNTRTTTKIRVRDATCAPRAPLGAQVPGPSAHCSAEPTPTTPP